MKKEFWLIIILAVIIFGLTGVLFFMPDKNSKKVLAPTAGIVVASPKENAWVLSPLEIAGTVNGDGWTGFEGQVGTIQLLDNKGKELASGILKATTDWTSLPTKFGAVLNFAPNNFGLWTLVFKNENPSGDPSKDKEFVLHVNSKAPIN